MKERRCNGTCSTSSTPFAPQGTANLTLTLIIFRNLDKKSFECLIYYLGHWLIFLRELQQILKRWQQKVLF